MQKVHNTEYNASNIESLDFPEFIRKRPDMYMGATTGENPPALYRMVREVLDNSLDEYLVGKNDKIYIKYDTNTKFVEIIDNGRGIPTDEKDGVSTLTLVFKKLHTGGKFNTDTYSVSSGKNGVGTKATNALSEKFIAYSNNNKKHVWYKQSFTRGIEDSKVVTEKPDCVDLIKNTGTVIKFKPDTEIFENIELNVDKLRSELEDLQYLCKGLEIHLIIDNKEEVFKSDKGISGLVESKTSTNPVFMYSNNDMDVALNFTKSNGYKFKSFVNLEHTDLGGTHVVGLKKAICDIIKSFSKKDIANDDILEGMLGAIHLRMAEPQYQSQTKNELTSSGAKSLVITEITPVLTKFFKKNKQLADDIVNYAEKMLLEKQKLKESKALAKGIKSIKTASKFVSDKFLDADRRKYKKVKDLELFVVEGDSAGGHFKYAREGYQAALKLRGKVINSTKADASKLFGGENSDGNKEIKSLVSALGCGIGADYNEKKLRFDKLIVLTDSDPDGQHITNLILSFLIRYIPQLIKDGHVYRIDAPLFIANSANYRSYGKTRNEVELDMKKHKVSNYTILRAKGWGECSADELATICVNPKTRKLIKIEWDKNAVEMLNKTMGDDVQFRKELLGVEEV